MPLADQIDAELARLGPAGGAMAVPEPRGQVTADLLSIDRLAVEFEAFAYETSALASIQTPDLKKLADALALRLNYLTEPIHVVEVDGQAGVAQLRSSQPQPAPSGRRYYEVLATRGGSLSLIRYEASPGQPRRPIPATVTREVFHRLAIDFVGAVP